MIQEAIFTVGVFVFMLAIWGAVMVGGYWMEHFDNEGSAGSRPSTPTGRPIGDDGAPVRGE